MHHRYYFSFSSVLPFTKNKLSADFLEKENFITYYLYLNTLIRSIVSNTSNRNISTRFWHFLFSISLFIYIYISPFVIFYKVFYFSFIISFSVLTPPFTYCYYYYCLPPTVVHYIPSIFQFQITYTYCLSLLHVFVCKFWCTFIWLYILIYILYTYLSTLYSV